MKKKGIKLDKESNLSFLKWKILLLRLYLVDRFNSALDLAEKRIGKLEGRFNKVTQNAAQDDKEKIWKRDEETWMNKLKRPVELPGLMGGTGGERKMNSFKAVFESSDWRSK